MRAIAAKLHRTKMNWYFCAVVVLCVAEVVLSKYLHAKESQTEKIDEIQFEDFFKHDENVYTDAEKGRFARHIELVTESVLDHLMREINAKYPNSNTDPQSSMPKMMQRLKMKLKKRMKKKKNKNMKKKKLKVNSTVLEMTTTTK